MKILMRKDLTSLRPADRMAEEALAKVKAGEIVSVDFARPRNLAMHRWWWQLVSIVADNMPGNLSPEIVCEVIKIRVGHVSVVRTAKGEVFIPKSISFAAMKQDEFTAFVDRAVRVIVQDILPGVDSDALTNEVEMMLAGAR